MRIPSPPLQFNLDPYNAGTNPLGVTVSNGAAVVNAAGGLPRRVTGALDYVARGLALGPSGYWPLNETSGQYLDRTANARHLSNPVTPPNRGLPGIGLGGSSGLSVASSNGLTAAGIYPEHTLQAGVPLALLVAVHGVGRVESLYNHYFFTTQSNPAGVARGFTFYAGTTVGLRIGNGSAATLLQTATTNDDLTNLAIWDARWHVFGLRYDGGNIALASSWRLLFDGAWKNWGSGTGQDPAGAGSAPLTVASGGAHSFLTQHAFVWAGGAAIPSEAQLLTLAPGLSCGTARWALPISTSARTLRGWQLPGRLARADQTRLGVRSYYQIDAAPRVEFEPGSDPAVAIPAGASCYIEADLTHHHLDDLPWLGTDLGGGPTPLVEEGELPPVYVAQPRAAAVAARACVASARGRASVAVARSTAKVGA